MPSGIYAVVIKTKRGNLARLYTVCGAGNITDYNIVLPKTF